MPNILLIDDDQTYLKMMETFLAASGWKVSKAATGAEGTALARSSAPDAILCDVNLPDADGVTLLADLRAATRPGLPIILISGNRKKAEDIIAGLDAGSHGYFAKPVDLRVVNAKLKALLQGAHP